jgi:copper chaperone NosL
MKSFSFSILIIALTISFAFAAQRGPVKPSPKDKCPVCGMFVYKYPDFLAEIFFKDGTYALFDGTKDMFKYYFNLKKYNPSKDRADIEVIYVTDYYTLTLINGLTAFYVLGSDVYGPMGHELIPFEKESDAKAFLKDHKGKTMHRFEDVTAEVIKLIQ